VRIPLDYYRILSVPIKATLEQLEQAYGDRLLQQPRREYNTQAIQARQELIQNAYQVLSDSEQRAEYDAQFLINLSPPEPIEEPEGGEIAAPKTPSVGNPTIEIPPSQFVGVLLILHELGEYELVLKLGIDYFNSKEYELFQKKQDDEVNTATEQNIILSLALAYLELGREQWHRREYENAALSGQMGLDLLIQENLFPKVKEEIEIDLFKLRPYRVLELIAQNSANSPERARGFQLLKEMLVQRQGIEGKGEDRSGLNFEQFLCFIQQLRTYLTSAEQQHLFEAEAKKSSAIANYLAVYALMARGFVLKQPELILRAQRMLDFLSEIQDVTWEQSVCALLLGHTQKAIHRVQNSQDTVKLEIITQYSVGSTDLLPGLCFYGEKWLQEEAISQFSDLVKASVTLKEYFADTSVQTYLEELASSASAIAIPSAPAVTQPEPKSTAINEDKSAGILSRWRNKFSSQKQKLPDRVQSTDAARSEQELVSASVATGVSSTAILERNLSSTEIPPIQQHPVAKTKTSRNSQSNYSPSLPLQSKETSQAVPDLVIKKSNANVRQNKKRVPNKKRSKSTLLKGWLFLASLIFGLGTMGFVLMKLFLNPPLEMAKQEAQLAIAINTSAVQLPVVKPKAAPVKPQPKLTFTDTSQQVIQQWLDSKSAAFGKEHEIDELNNILVAPLLATWRDRAIYDQQQNSYRTYEHTLKMRSAAINQNDPKQATVEAEVKEIARHYQAGQLDNSKSYNDNLLVRYQLVLQGEKWLIKNAEVLKTL